MDKLFIKERIANIRNANGISARKLSLELGQSSEYINQIETGKNMPSLEGLINFCEYFNISLATFFDETYRYPIQYKALISELNKLDVLELEEITKLIKLINSKK